MYNGPSGRSSSSLSMYAPPTSPSSISAFRLATSCIVSRLPSTLTVAADSRPSRLLQKTGHVLAWFEQYDPANAADAE